MAQNHPSNGYRRALGLAALGWGLWALLGQGVAQAQGAAQLPERPLPLAHDTLPLVWPTPNIGYSYLGQVVPNPSLPPRVRPQRANNNLDVVQHQGRYYLAFRTGPTHFPSRRVHLYVVSTPDFQHWRHEADIHLNNDLREPRFAKHNGQLMLYFFEGKGRPWTFHPRRVWVAQLTENDSAHTGKAPNSWSYHPLDGLDGYVPWRVRRLNQRLFLSAYYGVDLYKTSHQPDLRLFSSDDGATWAPLAAEPQVAIPGAEEGEFIFDDEGNLWGTVRLEGETGAIVHAPANDLANWTITELDRKFDSALLFQHKGSIYLVSRRNMDDGLKRLPQWLPKWLRHRYQLIRYSLTRKRTALFVLDPQRRDFRHLFDLPSTGDNAFPAIVRHDANTYYLLNYTSRFDRDEKPWIAGQLRPTFIYALRLEFKD